MFHALQTRRETENVVRMVQTTILRGRGTEDGSETYPSCMDEEAVISLGTNWRCMCSNSTVRACECCIGAVHGRQTTRHEIYWLTTTASTRGGRRRERGERGSMQASMPQSTSRITEGRKGDQQRWEPGDEALGVTAQKRSCLHSKGCYASSDRNIHKECQCAVSVAPPTPRQSH